MNVPYKPRGRSNGDESILSDEEGENDYTRDKDMQRLTDVAELVKRIFFDNRDLEALAITEWYNAKVTDIIYERDEEDTEVERFILTLECNVNEVIS